MATTPTQSTRWRSQEELDAVKKHAKGLGMSFAGFIRKLALEACGLPIDEPASAAAGRRMAAGQKDPWETKDAPADG